MLIASFLNTYVVQTGLGFLLQQIYRQLNNRWRATKFLGRHTTNHGGTILVKYEPLSCTLDITAYHGPDTNPAKRDWRGSVIVKGSNHADQKAVAADRYAFFTEFFKNFYNTDLLLGKRVSEQVVQTSWNTAAAASATASLACVPTWHEDFRKDLSRVEAPSLVIHGDADRIVPIGASGL